MAPPRIQVLIDDTKLAPEVRTALDRLDVVAEFLPLSEFSKNESLSPFQARLVLTQDARSLTNGKLSGFLTGFDRTPCSTLIISDVALDASNPPELRTPNRSIRFCEPLSADQLVDRLSAMLGVSTKFESLREELETIKRRDEAMIERLHRLQEELRLAGLIQRDLFKAAAPGLVGASIHALYRPATSVSGDVRHVARLDDEHVAIAVADATGHGLAAALLSVFIQRSLSAGGSGGAEHARSPAAVLARLNDELLRADLQECHFVSAVYAVYHEPTRTVTWARAGGPYPVLQRSAEPPREISSAGPLLGVAAEANFETVKLRLGPGDAIWFHSDGLECTPGWQSALSVTLAETPANKAFLALDDKLSSLPPSDDDVTVVVLQVHTEGAGISGSSSTPKPSATRLM